jgi:hypothetical protein
MEQLLSIDFDFWIPVREAFQPLYAERGGRADHEMWIVRVVDAFQQRCDLRDEIRLARNERPQPTTIADWMAKRRLSMSPAGIAVADQHFHAFHHFSDAKDGWLFHVDAHHDCGYAHTYDRPLDCGNWLLRLVERGCIQKVTIIYPLWRRQKRYCDECENPQRLAWVKKTGIAVDVRYGLQELPEGIHFAKTTLVRSGGWTPPWLDQMFNNFVQSMAAGPLTVLEPTPVRNVRFEECQRVAQIESLKEQRQRDCLCLLSGRVT